MTLPPEFIAGLASKRDEVHQAQQRVYEAQQKLALVNAELRGFEMAARLFDKSISVTPVDAVGPNRNKLDVETSATLPNIRRQWRTLLSATAKTYPGDLHLDDLEKLAFDIGVPANRNTLRSQLSIYAAHGVVERTGTGRYRLSPLGATAVGITLPSATPDATPTHPELIDNTISNQDEAEIDYQFGKEAV